MSSSAKQRKSSKRASTASTAKSSGKLSIKEYRNDGSATSKASTIHITHDRISRRVRPSKPLSLRLSSLLRPSALLVAARRFLASLFLPIGYPCSVTSDYLSFQVYDTIQATSSYLRGILCTQAILEGYGVGDASASAASATLTSMVRDGVSMFGGIVFAWLGAAAFGLRVKQFRLFADVINDVGMTIELLSPLYPQHFLLLACVGSLCRTLCGIAAGATRASLMAHFALTSNISDISAKEGIQETAVTLLGLLAGWQVVEALKGDLRLTWLTFVLLTAVHVWANVMAMRCLVLTALDRQRADLCIRHFIDAHQAPSPSVVASRERILPGCGPQSERVMLGARIDGVDPADVRAALSAWAESPSTGFMLVREGSGVRVLLERGASERTAFSGLFHGRLLLNWLKEGDRDESSLLQECYGEGAVMFDLFYSQLVDVGWKTAAPHLGAGPWRYVFTDSKR